MRYDGKEVFPHLPFNPLGDDVVFEEIVPESREHLSSCADCPLTGRPLDGLSEDGKHSYSDIILENLWNISDRTIEALRLIIKDNPSLDAECRRLLYGLLSIYVKEDTK